MTTEKNKVHAEIARRNLASHMNQKKWARVLPMLRDFDAVVRVKWLFDEAQQEWSGRYLLPVAGYFEETRLGPIPYREIEWLELKVGDVAGLRTILKEMHIPFSLDGDIIRIWGYSNHGVHFER
jgi:hypothetical protein